MFSFYFICSYYVKKVTVVVTPTVVSHICVFFLFYLYLLFKKVTVVVTPTVVSHICVFILFVVII